jgi:hypothetical protein
MTIRTFGIITILFWASHLLFLPSIKTVTPEMQREMAERREMKELPPEMYKAAAKLNVEHTRAVQSMIMRLVMILAGVVSGVLLLMSRFTGWIMAIVLCAGFLVLRILGLLRYYPDVGGRIKVIFTLLVPQHPAPIIYNEVITPLFFIGSVFFLARKSVGRQLMTKGK